MSKKVCSGRVLCKSLELAGDVGSTLLILKLHQSRNMMYRKFPKFVQCGHEFSINIFFRCCRVFHTLRSALWDFDWPLCHGILHASQQNEHRHPSYLRFYLYFRLIINASGLLTLSYDVSRGADVRELRRVYVVFHRTKPIMVDFDVMASMEQSSNHLSRPGAQQKPCASEGRII